MIVTRFYVILFVTVIATSCWGHGGTERERPPWERKLAGLREGLDWITTPFLGTPPQPVPTRVRLAQVGFGRTGTTSLEAALKILGYNPLQDDLIWTVTDIFQAAYSGELTMEGWSDAMGERGFDYVYFYHPNYLQWAAESSQEGNLKAILLVRDSPEQWAASWLVVASFGHIFRQAPFRWLGMVQNMLPTLDAMEHLHTGGNPEKYNHVPTLQSAYTQHIERVQEMFSADNLLIFNVKDGWGPLCVFLNKPIPDVPFPHINDRVVMAAVMSTLWAVVYIWRGFLLVIALGMIYFLLQTIFRLFQKEKAE